MDAMNKLALTALAFCCAAMLGIAPLTGKPDAPLPEDRDWPGYIGDGDTTRDMVDRALEGYDVLGKRMEKLLDTLYADLDDKGDALLSQTQSNWEAYAKSKRSFDADVYRGGTLSSVVAGVSYCGALCERINELKIAISAREPN